MSLSDKIIEGDIRIYINYVKQFIKELKEDILFRGKFRQKEEQNTLTGVIGDIDRRAGEELI